MGIVLVIVMEMLQETRQDVLFLALAPKVFVLVSWITQKSAKNYNNCANNFLVIFHLFVPSIVLWHSRCLRRKNV